MSSLVGSEMCIRDRNTVGPKSMDTAEIVSTVDVVEAGTAAPFTPQD